LAWLVGRAAERRALAETDGYRALAGVVVEVDDPQPRMPRMMRLASDCSANEGDAPARSAPMPADGGVRRP